MYTIINNEEVELKECTNFFSRLIGNMFKKNIKIGLVFNHCNSIHTFFMRVPIDILLCDKENRIMYIYNSLKPNRVILPKKNVSIVYEFPDKVIKNININEKISIYK